MKKIFRMALVFALAGATLLYTGCTKDYNEDINNLAGQINDLKSTHATDIANLNSALNNLESSLKSADAAIEAAYKKADDALAQSLKDAEGKIAANVDAINGLKGDVKDLQEAVEANEDDIKALNDDITKLAEDVAKDLAGLETKLTGAFQAADADLQKQIDDNLADAKNSLDEAKKLLLNELRSIVFVPELYYGGIEATEYVWTSYQPMAMVAAPKGGQSANYMGTSIVFPEGEQISVAAAVDAKKKTLPIVYLSQLASAQYELNPSSFDVAKADWSLSGTDYRFVVRADEEEDPVWAPVLKSISAEAGVATVRYTIENPWLLPTSVYAPKAEGEGQDAGALKTAALQEEVSAILADNGIEELANDEALQGPINRSLAYLLSLIFDKPSDQINSWKLNPEKFNDFVNQLNSDMETLTKRINTIGTQLFWDEVKINTISNELNRLVWDINMQKFQIAQLYALANQNYEGTGYVPVMNLTAALDAERSIVSDYEAIVSTDEQFSALAFASSEYKTWEGRPCAKGAHLYSTAVLAATRPASVVAAYDQPFDLDIINIHMWDAIDGEASKTLADLQKVYPELSMTYELVDYVTGANKTSQSAYAKIENGKFYAMTVDEKGNQIAPSADNNYAIASVGKCPVVLVKLFNGDDLVKAGYYKIEIVKEKSTSVITLPDFGTLPFICSYDALTTDWSVFSAKIIDGLGETYKSFKANYNIVNNKGWEMPLNVNNKHNAAVYVIDENPKSKTYGEYVMTDKFGTITYNIDANGAVVNDSFAWQLPANENKLAAGKTYTVYVKFTDGEYKVIYVAFTVSIAEPASFNFGANKIKNEWYTEVNNEVLNTVKVNVHVPSYGDGIDVNDYRRNLDHYFVNYEPSLVLADDVDPVYNTMAGPVLKYASKLATKYDYTFATVQPQIGKYTLMVKSHVEKNPVTKADEVKYDDLKTLYAYYQTGVNFMTGKPVYSDTLAVAKIEGREIIYQENTISKELLNLYKYDSEKPEEWFYANIHVDVTYGGCDIPAGTEDFHTRFLRPLEISWANATTIEESAVNGDDICIVDYLTGIVDWNHQAVIRAGKPATKETAAESKWVENKIGAKGSEVNMYKYYEFSKLYVDLENAQRDNWDVNDPSKLGYILTNAAHKGVTPAAKLEIVATAGVLNSGNPVVLDITDLENFFANNYTINYKNDEASVDQFTMYIPVAIEYAWGFINGTLTVKVQKTPDTK